MIAFRLLRLLHVPDALLGDLLEQSADRSSLWFWKQAAAATALAAWKNSERLPITVRQNLVAALTAWRFDRVWLFALFPLIGATSFWTVATGMVIGEGPCAFQFVSGVAILLGWALHRIVKASLVRA